MSSTRMSRHVHRQPRNGNLACNSIVPGFPVLFVRDVAEWIYWGTARIHGMEQAGAVRESPESTTLSPFASGQGVGDPVGVGVGVSVGSGDGDGVTLGDGDTVGTELSVGDGEAVGVAEGSGVGRGGKSAEVSTNRITRGIENA